MPAGDGNGPGRPRVLIADDNPDLRRYLTTLLASQFDVEAVSDGTAALAVTRERRPDLLISDVMMPGLDGYQLLEAVRSSAETQDLPVILLSARAGEEAAIEGLEAGADDYLPKPFSGRELLARVRAHLDLSTLRRQAAADMRAERHRLEQTLQPAAGRRHAGRGAVGPRSCSATSRPPRSSATRSCPRSPMVSTTGTTCSTLDRKRVKRDDGRWPAPSCSARSSRTRTCCTAPAPAG